MYRWIGCPPENFRHGRPFGMRPEAVVVHVMDGSFEAGESVFRDPETQKSAHYGVSRNGDIHQYVDENDTAFHAGIVVNPTWELLKPRVNPNFYTIGVEHEGRAGEEWTEAELGASAKLIAEIAARWGIVVDDAHIVRHHEIRNSKTCPGTWLAMDNLLRRIRAAGAAVPVAVAAPVAAAPGGAPTPRPVVVRPVETPGPKPIAVPKPASPASGAAGKDGKAEGTPKGANPVVAGKTLTGATIVRTMRKANLRRGRPSTTAPVVRLIPAHTELAVCKWEMGDAVDGNAHWYGDAQGNYVWAGATDAPEPGARL